MNPSLAGRLLEPPRAPAGVEHAADRRIGQGCDGACSSKVTADQGGKPLAGIATGLGHRICRGQGCFGFWEPKVRRLEPGDLIVEVVPRR